MKPEGAIFWIIIIAAITWLVILFAVFRSIASRKDIPLVAKAIWLIIIFMAPVLGLIAYVALGKDAKKTTSSNVTKRT